jgi:hypothetical protein
MSKAFFFLLLSTKKASILAFNSISIMQQTIGVLRKLSRECGLTRYDLLNREGTSIEWIFGVGE